MARCNRKIKPFNGKYLILSIMMIFTHQALSNNLTLTDHNSIEQVQDIHNIEIWHSYTADTIEDKVFNQAINRFEKNNTQVKVTAVRVPYSQLVQQFITASQGGEGPDLLRVTSQEIGKIGQVSINSQPLLEDLRYHLTPAEKSKFEKRALNSMRYNNALYGIPASQSTLSLLYNKDLFDAKGVDYPSKNWNLKDMLDKAKQLSYEKVYGLAIPHKVYLWWIPFQIGFGGALFDDKGNPTLDSQASIDATQWLMDLERQHHVIAPGKGGDPESVKTQFMQSKAAMIVDGSWNWMTYVDNGMNIGQISLPIVSSTGHRLTPLLSYIGYSIAKQSKEKVAATQLAMWLSSIQIQREFAIQAYTLPTLSSLKTDKSIVKNAVLTGFIQQLAFGIPAPTTKAMSLMSKPLETALELINSESIEPDEAFYQVNIAIKKLVEK